MALPAPVQDQVLDFRSLSCLCSQSYSMPMKYWPQIMTWRGELMILLISIWAELWDITGMTVLKQRLFCETGSRPFTCTVHEYQLYSVWHTTQKLTQPTGFCERQSKIKLKGMPRVHGWSKSMDPALKCWVYEQRNLFGHSVIGAPRW